jgi:hypothetical protein
MGTLTNNGLEAQSPEPKAPTGPRKSSSGNDSGVFLSACHPCREIWGPKPISHLVALGKLHIGGKWQMLKTREL